MKFKFIISVFISFVFLFIFFGNVAQTNPTKPLNKKAGFDMKGIRLDGEGQEERPTGQIFGY